VSSHGLACVHLRSHCTTVPQSERICHCTPRAPRQPCNAVLTVSRVHNTIAAGFFGPQPKQSACLPAAQFESCYQNESHATACKQCAASTRTYPRGEGTRGTNISECMCASPLPTLGALFGQLGSRFGASCHLFIFAGWMASWHEQVQRALLPSESGTAGDADSKIA
jgi:hypothetical protein